MSPYIHNAAFKFHNLNAVFVPLQVQNLNEFMRRMVNPRTREINWKLYGFAVTIPHKVEIMKHLTHVDETAKKIGAVNTVVIVDDDEAVYGYNTDAQGFIQPLHDIFGTLTDANAAVFGSGGAARAVCFALKRAGANVTIFARNREKAKVLEKDFGVQIEEFSFNRSYDEFDIVINATPLGTKGEFENETPATAEQIKNVHLAYDLVYNPFETRFLREAKSVNVPTIGGLAMLIAQAMEQQKIWTGLDAPVKEMSRAAIQKLQN
jgi:shikimate dehydrogenase